MAPPGCREFRPQIDCQTAFGQNSCHSCNYGEPSQMTEVAGHDVLPMEVLRASPAMTDRQRTSPTKETVHQPTHTFHSAASLNRNLGIAIFVPICLFILFAVITVAVYCSRLHRPHRKDASRRSSHQQYESVPPNSADSPVHIQQGLQTPNNSTNAILEALSQPKSPTETAIQSTDDNTSQPDELPSSSTHIHEHLDSSSDDDGTHFSDLEDPFIDHSEESPRSTTAVTNPAHDVEEQDVHDRESPTSVVLHQEPPTPYAKAIEIEDPFTNHAEFFSGSTVRATSSAENIPSTDEAVSNNAGPWLNSSRDRDLLEADTAAAKESRSSKSEFVANPNLNSQSNPVDENDSADVDAPLRTGTEATSSSESESTSVINHPPAVVETIVMPTPKPMPVPKTSESEISNGISHEADVELESKAEPEPEPEPEPEMDEQDQDQDQDQNPQASYEYTNTKTVSPSSPSPSSSPSQHPLIDHNDDPLEREQEQNDNADQDQFNQRDQLDTYPQTRSPSPSLSQTPSPSQSTSTETQIHEPARTGSRSTAFDERETSPPPPPPPPPPSQHQQRLDQQRRQQQQQRLDHHQRLERLDDLPVQLPHGLQFDASRSSFSFSRAGEDDGGEEDSGEGEDDDDADEEDIVRLR